MRTALDAIEGKSTSKQAHEQRQALLMPAPAVLTVVDVEPPAVEEPEPVAVPVTEPPAPPASDPWPVVVGVEPDCVPIFRVKVCE